MESMDSVLIVAVAALLMLPLPLVWILSNEIRKTYHLFAVLARRFHGQTRRFPPAAVFTVGRVPVKVSSLQGMIIYQISLDLREDPRLLIRRRLPWMERWSGRPVHTDPSRICFGEAVDEVFLIKGGHPEWGREVLDPDIRRKMTADLPLARVDIRRKKMVGMIRIWLLNKETEEACGRAVAVLNALAERVQRSSLANGG